MNIEESQAIDKALNIAVAIHSGQSDKGGGPYILHPIRVMMMGRTAEEMIVGVLHDVLEDGGDQISLVELKTIFGDTIAKAVNAITRLQGEEYDDYIFKVKRNPLAKTVKQYDLDDNLDPKRLTLVDPLTRDRLYKKYARARWMLSTFQPIKVVRDAE